VQTLFNELIQAIRHQGNPMGWSLHTVPIQKAVEQGLVDRINRKNAGAETTTDSWRACAANASTKNNGSRNIAVFPLTNRRRSSPMKC